MYEKADCGGMVSPNGLSYIGRSKEILGDIPAALACKRIHLDEAIAMAAKRLILTFNTLTLFTHSGKIRVAYKLTNTKTKYKYIWFGAVGGFQKAIWPKMFLNVIVVFGYRSEAATS